MTMVPAMRCTGFFYFWYVKSCGLKGSGLISDRLKIAAKRSVLDIDVKLARLRIATA